MVFHLNGMRIEKKITDYGISYFFNDKSEEIKFDLTEMSFFEFKSLSNNCYDFLEQYNIEDIVGLDWEIKLGSGRPNMMKIFKTMKILGQTYVATYFPNILYYEYKNEKMHRNYKEWIIEMDYEMIYNSTGKSFYYREK